MRVKDGKRIYGAWAGNPNGYPEKPDRCIEEVQESGRGGRFYQCLRARGFGEGGLYCKQHDPESVKARAEERDSKYRAKRKAEDARWENFGVGAYLRESNPVLFADLLAQSKKRD
jgi:hypothetical protein